LLTLPNAPGNFCLSWQQWQHPFSNRVWGRLLATGHQMLPWIFKKALERDAKFNDAGRDEDFAPVVNYSQLKQRASKITA
jgi:hypothetical protein